MYTGLQINFDSKFCKCTRVERFVWNIVRDTEAKMSLEVTCTDCKTKMCIPNGELRAVIYEGKPVEVKKTESGTESRFKVDTTTEEKL